MFLSAYNQNPKNSLDYPQFLLQKLFEVLPMFIQPGFSFSSLPDWRERDYAVPEEYSVDDVVFIITESLKNVLSQYRGIHFFLNDKAMKLMLIIIIIRVGRRGSKECNNIIAISASEFKLP